MRYTFSPLHSSYKKSSCISFLYRQRHRLKILISSFNTETSCEIGASVISKVLKCSINRFTRLHFLRSAIFTHAPAFFKCFCQLLIFFVYDTVKIFYIVLTLIVRQFIRNKALPLMLTPDKEVI